MIDLKAIEERVKEWAKVGELPVFECGECVAADLANQVTALITEVKRLQTYAADKADDLGKAMFQNATLRGEIKRLQAERDAAVADITHDCDTCLYGMRPWDEAPCETCREGEAFGGVKRTDNWEWREIVKGGK